MENTWLYTQNPFDNSTKTNFKKFFEISQFHLNALQTKAGDLFFDGLILDYRPKHNAYALLYNNWQTSEGMHKGKTSLFEDLIEEESNTRARQWDVALQNVYPQDSPRYVEMFPNRRAPFQKGSRDERVNAVQNLSLAIGADPALAAVKLDVDAFHTSLLDARNAQQGTITITDELSEDLNNARVTAAQFMYKNLGALINKYYNDTDAIAPYFDLDKIRSHEQISFTGHVAGNTTKNVFKRTLDPENKIQIKNTGTVALTFCIVPEKNDVCALPAINVAPDEDEIIEVGLLGNVPESKYFNVTNGTATEGNFEITIL